MTTFSLILLQAGPGDYTGFAFMIAIFAVMWLFFLRPQAKRQREQGEFANNLAKGDEVVTASGIIGKINKLDEKSVTLEVGKTFIQFTRNAVSKEMTDAYFASDDKD